jgi:hypothetical protein
VADLGGAPGPPLGPKKDLVKKPLFSFQKGAIIHLWQSAISKFFRGLDLRIPLQGDGIQKQMSGLPSRKSWIRLLLVKITFTPGPGVCQRHSFFLAFSAKEESIT